jgi:hypothetical protein
VLAATPLCAGGGNDPKDPPNWTPVRIPNRQKAPEFENIDAWLHTKPLKMSELKGKVVVISFMAFG